MAAELIRTVQPENDAQQTRHAANAAGAPTNELRSRQAARVHGEYSSCSIALSSLCVEYLKEYCFAANSSSSPAQLSSWVLAFSIKVFH